MSLTSSCLLTRVLCRDLDREDVVCCCGHYELGQDTITELSRALATSLLVPCSHILLRARSLLKLVHILLVYYCTTSFDFLISTHASRFDLDAHTYACFYALPWRSTHGHALHFVPTSSPCRRLQCRAAVPQTIVAADHRCYAQYKMRRDHARPSTQSGNTGKANAFS